ncbi:hypothetical protein [Rhizobium leguminosarum]|uniref:Uncharacterized protein n=1 Tax=Rhizobium leguminosarum TaxID=384 RepID=A0A7X0DSV3_RHILE|nr:hypothetical protein [Rhizobium leguminosarum]MBB6219897.1 hypothetical protein [Rhizobium leguminosarum]
MEVAFAQRAAGAGRSGDALTAYVAYRHWRPVHAGGGGALLIADHGA